MTNRPPTRPEDLFRAEKERALSVRNSQHARLLAEAKAAFDKLMAEGQAARKSGRPRKHPLPPLKTSSSRTPPPVKPPSPPPIAKATVTAPPVAPQKSPTLAKASKPAKAPARPAAKHANGRKGAKPKGRPAPVRAASKSKPKAKRSTRR